MTPSAERPSPPDVVLLGGNSGCGKTWLARELGLRFQSGWTQVDDVRLALQQLTTPETHPELHVFLTTPEVWHHPAEKLVAWLIGVGRLVSCALEIVVAHHVATALPIILEGDGIVPSFAAQRSFAGRMVDPGQVKAVFLVESDEAAILHNMRDRGRSITLRPIAEQRAQARMNALYGQWLRREAEQYGLPIITPRPWDTLVERGVAALEKGVRR